jgi:uncharacterized protein YfaT (DUF1175 family)
MRVAALLTALFLVSPTPPTRPTLDAQDRAAFLAWFTLLADAQFYRQTPDVTDCAALVRHAARESLREHTADWLRRMAIPGGHVGPDLRSHLAATGGNLPLFRVADTTPARYAEFADARTILQFNASLVSRDARAARPGDLLAFRQARQRLPDHLMVFVGRSAFEPQRADWVVYHTGPDTAAASAGEMRKASLSDLRRHPSPRWRPAADNPAFLGVYRLRIP